jgi:hypothetical protein
MDIKIENRSSEELNPDVRTAGVEISNYRTLREDIAMRVLVNFADSKYYTPQSAAQWAVEYADALIEELKNG